MTRCRATLLEAARWQQAVRCVNQRIAAGELAQVKREGGRDGGREGGKEGRIDQTHILLCDYPVQVAEQLGRMRASLDILKDMPEVGSSFPPSLPPSLPPSYPSS